MIFIRFLFIISIICVNLGASEPFIKSSELEMIRENPSCVYDMYHKYYDQLRYYMEEPNDEELYIIFCSIVSYSMAPYGNCTEMSTPALLHVPTLHCGKYGKLAVWIAEQGLPNIRELVKVHAVGWDHGPFGNHQTLFIHRSFDDGIFIDPTCAIVAYASFNHVCRGRTVDRIKIFQFHHRHDLDDFWPKVDKALRRGRCRPSHLLYYFDNVDQCEIWYQNHGYVPAPGRL